MDDLITGYRRFRAGTWRNERDLFESLSNSGQKPRALVIGCSMFGAGPVSGTSVTFACGRCDAFAAAVVVGRSLPGTVVGGLLP